MPDRDLEQRIRERAFFIWVEQGRPEGRDKEHWQQAASELTPVPTDAVQRAAPGDGAIGEIRYAAAREVDRGGTCGPRQFQTVAQSWDAYRR